MAVAGKTGAGAPVGDGACPGAKCSVHCWPSQYRRRPSSCGYQPAGDVLIASSFVSHAGMAKEGITTSSRGGSGELVDPAAPTGAAPSFLHRER